MKNIKVITKKRIYFENLDGLRFFCFLSVFFYHSFFTELNAVKEHSIYRFVKEDLVSNGNLGVNFFFVLSGFLITFLLIEEKKLNSQISLRNFYIRRILRIWPLFYFCVFFGFVIFPLIKQMFGQISNETATPIYYLTFTNNFDFLNKGLPDASMLGVLWSVAIEEQFYLIWPIVIFSFRIEKLWIPFTIVILFSLIFRALNDNASLHEYHTLSCIGDMTVGAMGAWLIGTSYNFKYYIEKLSKLQIGLVYTIFTFIYFFRDEVLFATYSLRIFERLFIAIIIMIIIFEQTYSLNSFFKMSNFKKITKLGTITYGLYCLHFIGILIAITLTKLLSINKYLWQILFVDTALALIITILISKISFKFFETPFLKLKDRFAYITK